MLKHSLVISFCYILSGCSNISYYSQAMGGQWEIYSASQPIEHIIDNPDTLPALKQQLIDILKIRAFATETLHLPENDSYTYYADLKRSYVVWSVFASPKFSFQPYQWCFPILGCVSYRGYFAEASAQTLATELRIQGFDVYVAGVPAYSTLGWFSDPVLNTMLFWPKTQIIGLIFHELAHQEIYIKDDTPFNEAFARTVEYVGVERWLAQHSSPEAVLQYQQSQQQYLEFISLVLTARNQLQVLYQKPLSEKKMLAVKKRIFKTLRTDIKTRWKGYDAWISKDFNNAKLLSVATYQDYVPAFKKLLHQVNGDLKKFYQKVAELGALPIAERQAILNNL